MFTCANLQNGCARDVISPHAQTHDDVDTQTLGDSKLRLRTEIIYLHFKHTVLISNLFSISPKYVCVLYFIHKSHFDLK